MEAFTQELIAISARISTAAAATCRDCLCAIVEQLQQQPEAEVWSLQDWWQWLDEEGYDRESWGLTLRHLCEASLENPTRSALQARFEAIRSEPSGIARLNEEIEALAPPLMARIEALTAEAIAEDQALKSTGAGLSKGGWIGVGLAGTGAGLGILAIARHRARKRAMEGAHNLEQNLRNGTTREGRAAEQYTHYESIRAEVRTGVHVRAARAEEKITAKVKSNLRGLEHLDKKELEAAINREASLPVNKGYWLHSDAINQELKALNLPDGAVLKPILESPDGIHYIVRSNGREMVKVAVEGQEFLFYKSTGFAGKDPGTWPIGTWFPVNGKGSDGWINKFEASPDYYGSKSLRRVAERLGVSSELPTFLDDTLTKVATRDADAVLKGINKGLADVSAGGKEIPKEFLWKSEAEMFKRSFPLVVKEKYPNLYRLHGTSKFEHLAESITLANKDLKYTDLSNIFKDPKLLTNEELLAGYAKTRKAWIRQVSGLKWVQKADPEVRARVFKDVNSKAMEWLKQNRQQFSMMDEIHHELAREEEHLARQALADAERADLLARRREMLATGLKDAEKRAFKTIKIDAKLGLRKRFVGKAEHGAAELEKTTKSLVTAEASKAQAEVRDAVEFGDRAFGDAGRIIEV